MPSRIRVRCTTSSSSARLTLAPAVRQHCHSPFGAAGVDVPHSANRGAGMAQQAASLGRCSTAAAVDESLPLGKGEREAICLAQELHADVLLLDDKKVRRIAQDRGLALAGTLAICALPTIAAWFDSPRSFAICGTADFACRRSWPSRSVLNCQRQASKRAKITRDSATSTASPSKRSQPTWLRYRAQEHQRPPRGILIRRCPRTPSCSRSGRRQADSPSWYRNRRHAPHAQNRLAFCSVRSTPRRSHPDPASRRG